MSKLKIMGVFIISDVSEKMLRKIDNDISSGDLGKARDRLHSLISTYPNNLELRKSLGDIYFALRYPTRAGLYWYLEDVKTPEMTAACKQFEVSMGNDLENIARALKFKGDADLIRDLDLRAAIENRKSKYTDEYYEYEETWFDKIEGFVVLFVIVSIVFFTIFGLYHFVKLIFWN